VDLDQVWGDHQSIVVAAMQALIAGESYMQTVVLRGDAAAVRALENALAGDVRLHHLRLHLVPVQLETLLGNAGFSPHVHASPLT
jgi:metal-responsive CopG/Arc/MetJ family transcriptional regulator